MNSWRQYNLDELYSFGSGISKPASYFGYGYPFLSFRVVFNNYFLPDTLPDLVDSNEKERHSCSIKRGDVFLTRTSETDDELGMSSVALKDYENATFNGFTKRLRPLHDKIIFPEFIGYYFRWSKFRANIVSMASVTTRASLNNSMLGSLCIELPSFPEQRAIASVLSSLDDKIDLLHRQNATLEAMAKALFKKWFVVEAKEEWEEYTVENISKQLSDTINPLLFSDLLFNLYSIPAYDLNKNPEQSYGKNILSNKFKIDANCLLVSKLNPKFPRIWLLLENNLQNSIASTEFIPIVPFDKQNLPFLYCLFSSDRVIQELTNAASGTSGSHQRVRPDDILNITFMTPSLKYISEFSNSILPFFKKISFNHRRIFTLEKLRDSLLPKLMSGEVRVKF